MQIIIKETGELKNLSLIDRKTGLDYLIDVIGDSGELWDSTWRVGSFRYDEERDAYICSRDVYEWWRDWVEDYDAMEDRIEALIEEHGEDAVNEAIDGVRPVDIEDAVIATNRALDEVFGKAA